MSCVYFAAILTILPSSWRQNRYCLLYITGHRPVQVRKYVAVWHKRAGLGSFMLAPGGPSCKTAGPCHLYSVSFTNSVGEASRNCKSSKMFVCDRCNSTLSRKANVISALPCKNFKTLKSWRITKTRCIRCLEESLYVRDVTSLLAELMVWNVIKNLAPSARSAFLSKLFNAKKNFEVTSKNDIREKEHQRNGRLMQRNQGKLSIFDFFRMFKTTA